ncbi:MAG: prephenate dehydrogenase [Oscillospiraceae bacterium]|jgi:prephenate dehydrogenase|nr:prephenate dehydrogenase [Oscillospiraceae bacterium]
MKKIITVIGLGLIGGSICKALCQKHTVFGLDNSKQVLQQAQKNQCIAGVGNLENADVVIVATPPKAVLSTIAAVVPSMKIGAVIADVCGVKAVFYDEINRPESELAQTLKKRNITYVGCHPMAGKEKFGFEHSDGGLFAGKDFIIAAEQNINAEAVQTIEALARDMGFAKITKCTPQHHDLVIAYTSQLAHIVSSCYVKSKTLPLVDGYCGGSFQDMTRVATLDKEMWADLFLLNQKNIVSETQSLINNLSNFLDALKSGDKQKITQSFADKAEMTATDGL